MEYQGLSKKALKVMRLSSLISTVIFLLISAFAYIMISNENFSGKSIVVIFIALIAVMSIISCIFIPIFRFKRYKYLIAEDKIEIIEGIFFISRTIVPIDRIHQIDIMKGPIDNIFKVAKVVITTAGSNATFRFLELDIADRIASYLNDTIRKKINSQRGNNDVQ